MIKRNVLLGGRTSESFHSPQCMFKGSLSKIFERVNNHIITKQTNKKGGLKILDTSRIKLKKYVGRVSLILA